VLPTGAVLAGRLLAGQLITDRHLAALGAVPGCYLLVLGHAVGMTILVWDKDQNLPDHVSKSVVRVLNPAARGPSSGEPR
jgi:hypothetical protein